jgi:signal transduction histidine kinase
MVDAGNISEARLHIARLHVAPDTPLALVWEQAAELAAKTLGVARVGIWIFSDDGLRLHCVHQLAPAGSRAVPELDTRDFPAYIAALRAHRWVCTDDAQNDPVTRELSDSYLRPIGITSMLDAPIFRSGALYGIVCHEHVGPGRHWTAEDRAFSGSVGDIVALMLEQAARLEAEEALRRKAEALRLAQKMEALGRLAAGVVHDVNNLLSAVDGLAALIERGAPPPSAARDIRDVASRGARLMRQLLAFARPEPSMPREIDLGHTVTELEPILTALAQGPVMIRVEAPAGAVVRADPGQIEQIVVNLALNARDAMPMGGVVEVAVEPGDGEAAISVVDHGIGMSDDVRARIFEPFFTTKPDGMGTGLGLATVWGLVRELRGRVEVESTPGDGSTFRIVLPRV